MKAKSFARYLKLSLLLLVILIIAGEILFRYGVGLGTPPLSVAHPTIEYMFQPNQDVWRFHNHQYYNRYGMRSEDFEKDRSTANELRVLVFGDSVINGGALSDQDNLATEIVDKKLEQESKYDRVIIGNISAGSWGPGNQIAYSREYGFFEADFIVLVISSHDAADVPSFAALDPTTHPTANPISALAEGLSRYIPRYLPSWLLLREKPILEQQGISFETLSEQGLSALKTFLTDAQATGAKVLVVQYLNREEILLDRRDPGFEQIHELCEQLSVPSFTTQKLFQEAVAVGKNPFRDGIHPNDLGQELLADSLISSIGVLEPAASSATLKTMNQPSEY